MELTRRTFLAGAAVAGFSALAVGATGCSSESQLSDTGADNAPRGADETIDCDIVVVGGGLSGLAAAVQAGANGDRTVVLEATGAFGGAGHGVEGIFATNSPLQKELSIDVSKAEVLTDETASTNYTNSGLHWSRMIDASADNIAWLLEQGAEFSGVVDTYMPGGRFNCFHWWKNGHAADGYVPQMIARAEALGVDMRTTTVAEELIVEDGVVRGLYASANGKSTLRVNAKAVILAAGGYIGNPDLLASQMLITEDEMATACLETAQLLYRTGSGVNMAKAVGAKTHPAPCIEGWFQPADLPVGDAAITHTLQITDKVNFRKFYVDSGMFMGAGMAIWVEEHGQRFTNEAAALQEAERTFTTRKFYKEHYQVFDSTLVEAIYGEPDMAEAFDQFLTDYPTSILKADTIEALAETVGLDPQSLRETIDTYNGYCSAGVDEDFGRDQQLLVPISKAPYYIFRCEISGDATLGGICTDIDFHALDNQKNPIPGLYMAGVDSCMLYNCVYPLGVPGTACCNSVHSGRTSANTAHAEIA